MQLDNMPHKATSLMVPRNWFLLIIGVLLGLCGCPSVPSLRHYMKSGIGGSIEGLRRADSREGSYVSRIGWKETTYNLPNGNWVWVEVDRKDCFIHWEVNPQGIIVGARTEGKGCRWQ